jgi:PAS domain S-box-containing protein
MKFPKLTVLILEDTPADAEMIADTLRNAGIDFDVIQVCREEELHRLLQEAAPDLIFADHSLVATHEESALAVSRRLHPTVPFIFISDTPGEEAAVEAVRGGATDYVLKHRLPRLGFVVHRALSERHQVRTMPSVNRGAELALCGSHERNQAHKRFNELSRLLRAVRAINKLIVRERNPDKLMADVCNILTRTCGYLHAGIGLSGSPSGFVPPITRSARKAEFLDGFSIIGNGDAAEALPARAAIHSGRSWLCQDIATDPGFAPWKEPALACGCASLAAVPMMHRGQVMGAITVCSDRVGVFHREEVHLLEELTGDLAFALESIRRDQACQSAESRLRLLNSALQSTANAIAITDRQGCLLWTNPAFTRLTGYTPEEANGKNPNFLKSGMHDPGFYRHLWQTILAGEVWHSEMVNRRKDGSLYTEECTITPVRDEKGDVTHFIAVKQDITDRKQAEEALRWRTAFFEASAESHLAGILVVDSHRRKILQNRRMIELWKIPPHIAEDPDDCKQVEFVTSQVKNPRTFAEQVAFLYDHTNEVSHDEIELTDGTVLDRYSSPVRGRDGTYYGRIWTFRDITGQRQLEAQLRQAQKMEAVGQLAGGVAHDFNNILTAITMHLSLLSETLVDPETAAALLELETEAKRAASLTRQLLMFSRKSAIEIKPTDLNQVVEEMLKMLQRLLGEHVSIRFRGTANLPLVEADHGMMEQVIMNLSVNARDAMPGGGQLTITTALAEFNESSADAHAGRRPGGFVRLSVADTGIGMDEATRKRIFEPFFTTKEIGKGTGLGLATVYGIVQQHRGWIEVASEPGKGSRFDVFLPATEKGSSSEAGDSTPVLRRGKETILLVEDETTVRLVTARGLQMLGYRVIEATDGPMALELWSRHADSIQLLLTDVIMPSGISGLELAERFQAERPGLKVIIATGYSDEISVRGIPSKPGIQFLHKPFGIPELATAIRACFDKK